jgi:predicted ATPase
LNIRAAPDHEQGQTMNETQSIATIHTVIIERYPMYKENPAFEAWLMKMAGTNEERIEEYLDTLSDFGYIDGEGMLCGDYTAVPEPSTVVDEMAKRLDRLDEPTRDVLRAASVEGPAFSTAFVARILERPASELTEAFSAAEAAKVIRRDGTGDVFAGAAQRFRFYPLQLRDTLYDELPGDRRAELHRLAITYLTDEIERNAEPGAREMMRQLIDEHNQHASRPAGSPE